MLVNQSAIVNVKVTDKDGTPIAGEIVVMTTKYIGSQNYEAKGGYVSVSGNDGIAKFVIGHIGATKANATAEVSTAKLYFATTNKTSSETTLKFTAVAIGSSNMEKDDPTEDAVDYINDNKTDDEWVQEVSANDGSTNTVTTHNMVGKTVPYVSSQQVSTAGTVDHQVKFDAQPYIFFAADDETPAKDFKQEVNLSSGELSTNDSKGVAFVLNVDPSKLKYLTINLDNLKMSKKSALYLAWSGIPASIIAFDSWFAVPHTISRLMKEAGLTVIARLKTNSKQYYEYDGNMINIKALYTMSRKRRGKAAWKLSVNVNLLVKDKNKIVERIPVKLVYLPNRANAKEWICLLSTDTEMNENEIIRQYGKRRNIECMFKCSKQYLHFGKDFQAPSFEAQNAQIAIAFTRYMLIAIEQRESEDYRSCGELFMLFYQELQDITFIKSLALIVALFKEGMRKLLDVTETQIQSVVDYVLSALPGYLQRSLYAANSLAQTA